jgi:hypothetical protein
MWIDTGTFSFIFIVYHGDDFDDYNHVLLRHEAQQCFCGEDNCVGFIGGKTQTDLGGMDELYLDGASFSSCALFFMS